MREYLFLMHDDAPDDERSDARFEWASYLAGLQTSDNFQGGSAIGEGLCVRKSGMPAPLTAHLSGYIRLEANSLANARELLVGNPVFEAGGTIEIRELPRTNGIFLEDVVD